MTFLRMFMVIMHSVRQLLKLNHRVGLSVGVYALHIVIQSIAVHPVISQTELLDVFCYCMTLWLLLTVSMLYKYNGVGVAK